MNHPLHPEVVTPSGRLVAPLATAGITVAVGALGIALLALVPAAVEPTSVPPPTPAMTEMIAVPVPVLVPALLAPTPRASLMFQAEGIGYLMLTSLDGEDAEATPRHGTPRLAAGDDYIRTAIAEVADRDVPRAHRAWQGTEVIVDGRCHARVTGFAIVSRLTGDPDYAGTDDRAWQARSVMEHGAPALVARLDACATGQLATAAALAPLAVGVERSDPAAIAAAQLLVIASPDAALAQQEWASMMEGTWHAHDYTVWSGRVVRHPRTGHSFVSILATHDQGCGGPSVRIWHLFQIEREGGLRRVPTGGDPLLTIDQLVDVDDDGTFEVIGSRWHGPERTIQRTTGEAITSLDVPFFGCSC